MCLPPGLWPLLEHNDNFLFISFLESPPPTNGHLMKMRKNPVTESARNNWDKSNGGKKNYI